MSKCAVCDQRPAPVYIQARDDMYCNDCADEIFAEARELLGITHSPAAVYPVNQQEITRCNNCMNVYLSEDDLIVLSDDHGDYYACPKCKSDEYLMDNFS